MFVSYLLNPMLSFSKKYKFTELPFPLKLAHQTAHELLCDTCVVDKITYIQGWVEYDCPLGRLSERTRGPFLESPGNFTGPKSNIQIEI